MRLTRWWVGAAAAFGLALMIAPAQRAQAMPTGPGAASAVKGVTGDGPTRVRFGGHFGGRGGFGHAHFHGGGFGGFHHGGFFHRRMPPICGIAEPVRCARI